jgi:DNA modification methylase
VSTCNIIVGDCLESLRRMPSDSVRCCVTSPPYWGLRDYGVDGQIGLEETFDEFLDRLVAVFDQVRRVLTTDGTAWVNMGDSYAQDGGPAVQGTRGELANRRVAAIRPGAKGRRRPPEGLKPKDLIGQPWELAFSLRRAGWYLRQDIIWHKPAPMPESVRDRCTKAHEYLFLLSKSHRYFWSADAMKEPVTGGAHRRKSVFGWAAGDEPRNAADFSRPGVHPEAQNAPRGSRANSSFCGQVTDLVDQRNRRSVWTIPSEPFKGAHFATFPPSLVRPCILASTAPGDTVLDPFGGSGTTGAVALELGRNAVLLELNPEYAAIARERCNVTPGLCLP